MRLLKSQTLTPRNESKMYYSDIILQAYDELRIQEHKSSDEIPKPFNRSLSHTTGINESSLKVHVIRKGRGFEAKKPDHQTTEANTEDLSLYGESMEIPAQNITQLRRTRFSGPRQLKVRAIFLSGTLNCETRIK